MLSFLYGQGDGNALSVQAVTPQRDHALCLCCPLPSPTSEVGMSEDEGTRHRVCPHENTVGSLHSAQGLLLSLLLVSWSVYHLAFAHSKCPGNATVLNLTMKSERSPMHNNQFWGFSIA